VLIASSWNNVSYPHVNTVTDHWGYLIMNSQDGLVWWRKITVAAAAATSSMLQAVGRET
jgi:hypothetical protein